MPQFIVTYVQEATQTVNAADTHAAGALAKQYAAEHKGLQVLSVYRVGDPAVARSDGP
jgi:hypothetical protein